MLDRYKKAGGFAQLLKLIETSGAAKQAKFLDLVRQEDPRWWRTIEKKMLNMDRIFSWGEGPVGEIFVRVQELTLVIAKHGISEEHWEMGMKTFSHGQRRRIEDLAEEFADKHHSLFLGRGSQYPIAMEGALKLKEISYIHAEAYAAGELKHGPLALIDADMPIIVVAPNNELLEKLKSNVEEVRARGGIIYVFADKDSAFESDETMRVINVNHVDDVIAPVVYTIPLQLLSYYVAVIKGTDVDQPRNLAKSVTVE